MVILLERNGAGRGPGGEEDTVKVVPISALS